MIFRFRPVLTIFTGVALIILIGLGSWQMQRRAWKNDLVEKVETRVGADAAPLMDVYAQWRAGEDAEYRPVAVDGEFRHDLEAHVFGTLDGAAGYYVFTPLELANDNGGEPTYVYVNRGFAPQDAKDQAAREAGLVMGEVRVRGLFRADLDQPGLAAAFQPPNDVNQNRWHQRDPSAFAAQAGVRALPVVIDSFGDENPGALPKGGVTRLEFHNRHFEYALTWFGLAGALMAVWLAFSLRRD